jgi:hypothetical protein
MSNASPGLNGANPDGVTPTDGARRYARKPLTALANCWQVLV